MTENLPIPDFIRRAERVAEDRDKLCKNNPACPECGTRQVQIIEVSIQEWKCRHCKHVFNTAYKI